MRKKAWELASILVEHWYASDGGYATFRYALDKKKDAWVGTFAWTYADGTKVEGPSVVEKKSPDEWKNRLRHPLP